MAITALELTHTQHTVRWWGTVSYRSQIVLQIHQLPGNQIPLHAYQIVNSHLMGQSEEVWGEGQSEGVWGE